VKFIRVDIAGWRKLLLGLLCVLCELSGASAFPEDAHMESVSHDDCPNFTGTYKLYGEALPGMPLDFRVSGRGMALDIMLGLDLNVPQRGRWSNVQVVHADANTMSVKIVGSTVSRSMQLQPDDKVLCQDRRLKIERLRETKGEATTGQALIIDQLELAQDGSLIVRTEIRDRSTFLFFDVSSPPEFYGALFLCVH
jgi:hypothetical protein